MSDDSAAIIGRRRSKWNFLTFNYVFASDYQGEALCQRAALLAVLCDENSRRTGIDGEAIIGEAMVTLAAAVAENSWARAGSRNWNKVVMLQHK